MTFALAFWILMLIWLIFGIWRDWPNHFAVGGNLRQWVNSNVAFRAGIDWHAILRLGVSRVGN